MRLRSSHAHSLGDKRHKQRTLMCMFLTNATLNEESVLFLLHLLPLLTLFLREPVSGARLHPSLVSDPVSVAILDK